MGGTVNPSVFAVLRLITSSNLTDCVTGRSAGFVPLRTLPGIYAGLPIRIGTTSPIADDTAGLSKLTPFVHRRNCIACRHRNKLRSAAVKECISANQETARLVVDHLCESRVEIAFIGRIHEMELYSSVPTCLRQFLGLSIGGWIVWIDERGERVSLGYHFVQQAQSLGLQHGCGADPRDVRAWPVKACDKTELYGVNAGNEDNWNCGCCRLCCD